MTTELEPRQPDRLTVDQLRYVAGTELVPKAYRNNMPAIMAGVLTGRELGIGDMQALRSINIVDGRPNMGAELMVALARRAGHSIQGTVTDSEATVVGCRGDNHDTMTVTWNLEMAKRAGLAAKDNWKKYPEAMLWSRAVSQLCRMLFSDIFMGLTYTGEEVGEERVTLQVVTDQMAAPTVEPDPEPTEVASENTNGSTSETIEDAEFEAVPFGDAA